MRLAIGAQHVSLQAPTAAIAGQGSRHVTHDRRTHK